ncbi:MAG: sigma-70 family RNA polymerase sigma factor [Planctomycetales bacterium]|nr:sigma-70 family RNA polymerase sigma factor [Planctomycetales bacterium]
MNPPSTSPTYDPARLIQDHQAGVWRYLRSLGCDRALADDLTQETFLKVLQSSFEHRDDQATGAYLRTVARNLFVSFQRRRGVVVGMEELDLLDAAWQRWLRDDSTGDGLIAKLRQCFSLLTERAQQSLRMRFEDRASRSAIAAALNISEHGAKNLMQRAKQQLRECVERKISDL